MRNQLQPIGSTVPDVVYAAAGNLDGHEATLYAWREGKAVLSFGPCSIALSTGALEGLFQHLANALDAIDAAEREAQQ